jgi:uncharacterized membrane protein YqhA
MTVEAQEKQPLSIKQPPLLKLLTWTRYVSVIAVLSSLAGSLLMLFIGTQNTLEAFLIVFNPTTELVTSLKPTEEATLQLLESLDNFLVGLAFLYFAYGIYSLFILLGQDAPQAPQWLKVKDITTLKKSLLEVLVVLLSVVFVKGMLEKVKLGNLEWQILIIPLSIMAIALSLRLMGSEGEANQ